MLRVIGSLGSRAFRVVWMLEELGLPYEFSPEMPHSEEVLKHNPSGKVPILLADGEALTDSTAIVQYLADAHCRFTFQSGTLERARQDGLTNLLLDEFDACLWMAARHSILLPEERRVRDIKPTLRWEFGRSARRLAACMRSETFLAGPNMTVPDFILAHCLAWAKRAKFTHAEPVLDTYFERMSMRPAYLRAAGRET